MKDPHQLNKLKPFGESDCESEVDKFGIEGYSDWYFPYSRFNQRALRDDVYLIIGRRGSGKTALSNFFFFQKYIKNTSAIDVDEVAAFQNIFAQLAAKSSMCRSIAIPTLEKVWEYIVWSILFEHYKDKSPLIRAVCTIGIEGNISRFIRQILELLYKKYIGSSKDLLDHIEEVFNGTALVKAKEAVLDISRKNPVIISFDTLENYSIDDDHMMLAVSSLIQFTSVFSRKYSEKGIYIKVFMMDEIFPELKTQYILNPLKSIKNEMYLHWRPKDLMRMICWRLSRYFCEMKIQSKATKNPDDINWDNYKDVLKNYWIPHFGDTVKNGCNLTEETFPYLLRHTQMRPRQLIFLCNSIANIALQSSRFPEFGRPDIVRGIKLAEKSLAEEVLNAYSQIYPGVDRIVNALSGLPSSFKGELLDQRAKQTAAAWPRGEYSPDSFRQLVAKLGIVGRVRQMSHKSHIVEADFEYARKDNLVLLVDDMCVVHPMFYRKLNIKTDPNICAYPFPDQEEFS